MKPFSNYKDDCVGGDVDVCLSIWIFESYQLHTRLICLKVRVIDKYAAYSAYTTVISHMLQSNILRAVLYRLRVRQYYSSAYTAMVDSYSVNLVGHLLYAVP